ncbi:MAG: hypothetical protein AAFV19_18710 [Pseudomonadota bacterium]
MAAVQAFQDQVGQDAAPSPVNNEQALLNSLRFVALECRAKSRVDLFESCALLAVGKTKSQAAHAEALMRCLDQALGKRPVLYRPGTEETSFDEAWLLELCRAVARGDDPSATFLIFSRVRPQSRRHIRFLMGGITECFYPD